MDANVFVGREKTKSEEKWQLAAAGGRKRRRARSEEKWRLAAAGGRNTRINLTGSEVELRYPIVCRNSTSAQE
jgi:hypothetical protein